MIKYICSTKLDGFECREITVYEKRLIFNETHSSESTEILDDGTVIRKIILKPIKKFLDDINAINVSDLGNSVRYYTPITVYEVLNFDIEKMAQKYSSFDIDHDETRLYSENDDIIFLIDFYDGEE